MTEMSEIKRRRKTSPIWNYFSPIDNRDAFCNECRRTVSYKSTTTNLKKHLASKHPNISIIGGEEIIYSQKIAEDFEHVGVEYEIESNTADDEDEQEENIVHIVPNKLLIAKKTPQKSININNAKKNNIAQSQKKLKVTQPNNKTEMIQEAINILSNVSQTEYIPENEEDEFAQFGKYLIAQLRQLPLVNALQLQEKFQSLLTRERINIMLKSTQPQSGLKSCVQQHQCCTQHQCSSPSTQHQCVQQNQYTPHRIQQNIQQNQSIEQTTISESIESEVELNQEGESSKVPTPPINKILYIPNIE